MPRPILQMTAECDPQSSLMSDAAVCRFLGIDGAMLKKLVIAGQLTRVPIVGSFARSQVIQLHDEALRGKESPQKYREAPILG